jgi:hypothetical protein
LLTEVALLNVARSADRRRRLGGPRTREETAPTGVTLRTVEEIGGEDDR